MLPVAPTIVVVVVIIAAICACGDPSKRTPMGYANRFLVQQLPDLLLEGLERCGLQALIRWGHAIYAFFFLQRNPFVLIGYILLMATACGAFIVKGYPRLPNSYLAQYHQVTGTMAMLFAWWTFYKAATVPAGKITARTLGKFSRYAYDDVMYSAENVCKTCGFEKPARSKHCKVMNACVPKYDHYCIWLNQAVGAGNYRWFLLFLLSHVGLLLYGTVASAGVLAGVIDEQQLWTAKFVNRTTGARSTASWRVIFQYLMATEMEVMMVGVLCAIMAVVLIGFFGYHCYLTAQNLTTNETFKWNYIIELYHRWVKSHPLAQKEWLELQKLPQLTEQQQKQKVALERALATPPPKQPPVNMYNRGIWENVREVMWPLHERPASALPAHAALLPGAKPAASEPAKQLHKSKRKRK